MRRHRKPCCGQIRHNWNKIGSWNLSVSFIALMTFRWGVTPLLISNSHAFLASLVESRLPWGTGPERQVHIIYSSLSLTILTAHYVFGTLLKSLLDFCTFFLTCLWLLWFQEAADEQMNCTDCVISPFTQRPDQMFYIFFKMRKKKYSRISHWRFDDCRNKLTEKEKLRG